jgi:hypothetical protein
MNFAVEVVHHERAKERDLTLSADLIEQVLESHAGGNVPPLPQDIHHFSPPTHFFVAPSTVRLFDNLPGEAEEYGRIRHAVPYEAGKKLIGVNHRQLSAFACSFHIYTLGLETRSEGVPVSERRHQDEALSVREGSAGESTYGAVEKILVLIQLHDVLV